MNQEQLRQNAAAMLAFADGKPVEWANSEREDWTLITSPDWDFRDLKYRPKPEPVTRPWSKPADVPLNCWVRRPSGWPCLVVEVDDDGIVIGGGRGGLTMKWRDLHNCHYSTDRVCWSKCEVTEGAK